MILTAILSFVRKSVRAIQAAQLRRARVQLALHGFRSSEIDTDLGAKR
jgi:hypothetical protein